jgi:hypothetical protein
MQPHARALLEATITAGMSSPLEEGSFRVASVVLSAFGTVVPGPMWEKPVASGKLAVRNGCFPLCLRVKR